jgi:hypothetical protein
MSTRFIKSASLSSAALLIALGTAFAQPAPSQNTLSNTAEQSKSDHSMRGKARLSPEDQNALLDGRIAGMLAALKLTPDQQKLWTPVEKALRDQNAERGKYHDRKAYRELDFLQRLDKMSERATQHAERAKSLSDAIKPLWATLDERQKRLMPMLMRMGGGRGGHHGHKGGSN